VPPRRPTSASSKGRQPRSDASLRDRRGGRSGRGDSSRHRSGVKPVVAIEGEHKSGGDQLEDTCWTPGVRRDRAGGDTRAGRPPARPANAGLTSARIAGVGCGSSEQTAYHHHIHLVIFINGKPTSVPIAIGFTPPAQAVKTNRGYFAEAPGGADPCLYWLHVHAQDIPPTMRAWMSASDAVDLCTRDSVTVDPVPRQVWSPRTSSPGPFNAARIWLSPSIRQ
jgi:hypothetical protein